MPRLASPDGSPASPRRALDEGRSLITSRRSMTGTRSRISRCFALTSQSIRAAGNARRSAAATGIACTMSPSAPSRTMRIRFIRRAMRCQEVARRVVLRIADDRGPPAVRGDHGAFGHRLHGVVGALAVHVGLEEPQQSLDGSIGEHDHVVDAAQRSPRARRDRPPAEWDGRRPSAPPPIDRR